MVDPMKLAERKRELTHEEYLAMSRRDWLLYQARRDAIRDQQSVLIDFRREYVEGYAKGYAEGFLKSYRKYSSLYPEFFGEDHAEDQIPLAVQTANRGFRSLPIALQDWLLGLSRKKFPEAVSRLFKYDSAEAFWDEQKKLDLELKALKASKRSKKRS
jgi:hypothetical protein